MKSAPAIAFDYRISQLLMVAVWVAAILAGFALAMSGMPWWCKLVVGMAAATYLLLVVRREYWRMPKRVVWQAAGHWTLLDRDEREQAASLRSVTLRGSWIFLSLDVEDRLPLRLVLAPDNCDADARRRLRVRLAQSDREPSAHAA